MTRRLDQPTIAWALYDWANSAFATTVMAGFFPVFFKTYWSAGGDPTESTLRLGLANSLGSLVILLLAPILGAIADRCGGKKRFLLAFTALGALNTGSLFFVQQGAWEIAVLLYVFGSIGFSGSIVFYDALIVNVADDRRMHRVSALGYGLGYLGGGVLFAVNVAMTLSPHTFGLADAAMAVRVSFVMVAAWWLMFAVPLFLFVPESRPAQAVSILGAVTGGLRQLHETFREIRRLRMVALFLGAYWLYIDGVDTVIRMAVDYGLSIGLKSDNLIVALLITQFVGFPAALIYGRMGDRYGAKAGLFFGIGVYTVLTIWATRMDSAGEFYALAVIVGLVQGGIQALSRSFYARIIPAEKAGEFFGFYNMLGKFAAVLGPLLVGWAGVLTGSPRYALLSLVILFAGGALLLSMVDEREARRQVETSNRRE